MRRIGAEVRGIRARRLVVSDELPANMALVAGSLGPEAGWDAAARTLGWDLWLPPSPVTLTYQIRPQEVGEWPTNVRAAVTLHDFQSRTSEKELPIPLLVVESPHAQATPPDGATPTPTSSPGTPPPPPTPAHGALPVYLPWATRS
jgi:hypothetical protein